MVACANTSAKIVKIVYKILHENVIYDPLHDIMKKNGNVHLPGATLRDEKAFRLSEARKRANRFRKFTRQTVVDLPQGEMKSMLTRVLEILDKTLDKTLDKAGVKK